MAEKVTIGNAELWHGDCREVLSTLLLANTALVTDPPYGLGDKWQGGGGSKKSSWRFDPKEAMSWDGETVDGLEDIAALFGEAIIWGGNYYRLEPSRCWLVWDKKQNDRWTTGQAELAWTNLDRPVRAFRFAQCEQANEGPKSHPTQKPLALMAWCLKWLNAEIVCDPYMGSGTTGVACARAGKQFTGIEREQKYFDIACERIEQAQAQGQLLPPEQPKQAEQHSMELSPNAEAQLPPERPQAAEGTRNAAAFWAVNCSASLEPANSLQLIRHTMNVIGGNIFGLQLLHYHVPKD